MPIDWQLYLPEKWAKDRRGRKKAGVPEELKFQTKPQIALEQIRAAKAAGIPIGIVLADAGYGNETAWREALSKMELEYCVGIQSVTTVWAAGTGPVAPKTKDKIGRPRTRWQRVAGAKPLSVKGLAETLTPHRWRTVVWREGSNAKLSSRFAALRVRAASDKRFRLLNDTHSACTGSDQRKAWIRKRKVQNRRGLSKQKPVPIVPAVPPLRSVQIVSGKRRIQAFQSSSCSKRSTAVLRSSRGSACSNGSNRSTAWLRSSRSSRLPCNDPDRELPTFREFSKRRKVRIT